MAHKTVDFSKQILDEEINLSPIKHGTIRQTIGFCYPNNYGLGMSNLGFQSIYACGCNRMEIFADRIFTDSIAKSRLKSIERKLDPGQFDVLVFSVSYELDYINLVKMLLDAGIPPMVSDRTSAHPIIIVGGIAPTINPLTVANFADAVFLGEGDGIFHPLFDLLVKYESKSKEFRIAAIFQELTGFYVPSLHKIGITPKIIQGIHEKFSKCPPMTQFISPHFVFPSMLLVETARGCQGGCRFCAAGFLLRPFRYVEPQVILDSAIKYKNALGKVGLVGASVLDHPEIVKVLEGLIDFGFSLTISSVRASRATMEIMGLLHRAGMKSVAFAPETASDNLRATINKHTSEDEIISAVSNSLLVGFKRIKLYYMVGLPGEIDSDIIENCEQIRRIDRIMQNTQAGASLSITASVFVPKLGTPFQWAQCLDEKIAKQRMELFSKTLQSLAPRVAFLPETSKEASLQYYFARDDGTVGRELPAIINLGGKYQHFRKILLDGSMEKAIKLRSSLVENIVETSFLREEYELSEKYVHTPQCAYGCTRCGGCN